MKKLMVVWFATAALTAQAGVFGVGNVAIVEDSSNLAHANVDIDNMQFALLSSGGRFCRDSVKQFLPVFGDNYDGVFTFTPAMLDDLMNVQQGQPVRWSDQGIGANPFDWGSQFGSAAKLSQCVFMGSLPKLPASPDGPATVLFGLPLGITGVELLGHEYGHHWMTWVSFDKNDGRGPQDMLRGYDDSQCMGMTPCAGAVNGHYGYHVNSHSVMYGNFITDNMNGTFSLTGGDRKYGELDQYLMGLRGPSEVSPVMILDDGSHHSSQAGPHGKSGTDTISNMSRIDVNVADIVRVHGPRVPAYPNAQNCWRVAFILTVPPGQTYRPADVAKVEAYRQRWEQWFDFATDGRGTMDTRLVGNGCLRTPPVVTPDAGMPVVEEDAGVVEPVDAGTPVEELPGDGGMMMPPDDMPMLPVMMPHVPTKEETRKDIDTVKLKDGCSCNAGPEAMVLMAAVGLLLRRRRAP